MCCLCLFHLDACFVVNNGRKKRTDTFMILIRLLESDTFLRLCKCLKIAYSYRLTGVFIFMRVCIYKSSGRRHKNQFFDSLSDEN